MRSDVDAAPRQLDNGSSEGSLVRLFRIDSGMGCYSSGLPIPVASMVLAQDGRFVCMPPAGTDNGSACTITSSGAIERSRMLSKVPEAGQPQRSNCCWRCDLDILWHIALALQRG